MAHKTETHARVAIGLGYEIAVMPAGVDPATSEGADAIRAVVIDALAAHTPGNPTAAAIVRALLSEW